MFSSENDTAGVKINDIINVYRSTLAKQNKALVQEDRIIMSERDKILIPSTGSFML